MLERGFREKLLMKYHDIRVITVIPLTVRAYVFLGDVLILLGLMKPEGYLITHGIIDENDQVKFIKRI